MGLAVTLPDATVEVAPGRSRALDVVVQNDGSHVAHFRLELAGRAGPWVQTADGSALTASAPWTPLEPGQALTVPLRVTPPQGAARAGQLVPFTVLARAQDGTTSPSRATGLVSLLSTPPVTAALVPGTTRSATASQHVLELVTDDPTGVLVTLTGRAADPGTEVVVDPVAVRVGPGRSASATVTVRPGRPALLGTRAHAFEVGWETDGPDGLARGSCAGRLEQSPRLPPLVTVLLACVLLVVLAAGAWTAWPSRDGSPAAPDATPGSGAASTALPAGDAVAVVQVQLRDVDPEVTRTRAQAVADGLVLGEGLRAEVVDSAQGPAGYQPGYWLVVVRGFPDRAAVDAFCAEPPPGAPACQAPP